MNYCDNKEKALKNTIIPQNYNDDFFDFWKAQVTALRSVPLSFTREKLALPYDRTFTTYEIVFNTHDKTMVHAYFCVPVGSEGKKLPCVAYYHGGGGRKTIYPDILATGVCCFAIDVRSQAGITVDQAEYSLTDNMGGLMTHDITDKNRFYMRNIYLDAVRAMDVIAQLPEVDPDKIVTFGQSQGGALSVAASALSGRSRKCYVCEPSYCCLHERMDLETGIFGPAAAMLRIYPHLTDTVFDTLTYFDINNIASMLTVDTDFCLALSDPICLPKFVYSAYSHVGAANKNIHFYPFVQHFTPEPYHRFFHEELARM